jgi:hypothetical protein
MKADPSRIFDIRDFLRRAREWQAKTDPLAKLEPDVLFGALCLLMALLEATPHRRRVAPRPLHPGLIKRLWPILIARARPPFRSRAEKAIDDCGFNEEQRALIVGWIEGRISVVAAEPRAERPLPRLEYQASKS